jgi:hypothetical protein
MLLVRSAATGSPLKPYTTGTSVTFRTPKIAAPLGDDHIGLKANKLINDGRQPFPIAISGAGENFNVAPFHVPLGSQAAPEGIQVAADLGERKHGDPADPRRLAWCLLRGSQAGTED